MSACVPMVSTAFFRAPARVCARPVRRDRRPVRLIVDMTISKHRVFMSEGHQGKLLPMNSREHLLLNVAVDIAILTVRDNQLQVLVIERANEPYQGQIALPGGFLREGEDLREAADRELAEETGFDGKALHLEQLGAYSAPGRDPRGRVVSVAYLAIAPDLPAPAAGSDARSARWAPAKDIYPYLAFDHAQILDDAVERARRHLELTTLATAFCGAEFTIGDLRNVYEVVWDMKLDPRNFSRKVAHTEGFVHPTGAKRLSETGRPAILYTSGPARALNPPLLRN
jgi:8-oxo-dGTP diphosphatase